MAVTDAMSAHGDDHQNGHDGGIVYQEANLLPGLAHENMAENEQAPHWAQQHIKAE